MLSLEQLAATHTIDVTDIQPDGDPAPSTRAAACRAGVETERAVIAFYDEARPQVAQWPDAVQVFDNLRTASADSHLPAFQQCA